MTFFPDTECDCGVAQERAAAIVAGVTPTLGEALPREMSRVRDKVMPAYQAIGSSGAFALTLMRNDLDRAAKALAEGDVIEMLRVYESLKGYTT